MTALVLAVLIQSVPSAYDGLVAEAVAAGKQGRYVEARASLDQAIVLDRRRPEAFVERGGLLFLQKDYAGAVRDLQRALDRRDDPYARDILAAALHLSGRPERALREWNRLGRPLFGHADVTGTHPRLDRLTRELVFVEGRPLTPGQLQESRTRLQETGLFRAIHLTPLPRDGRADVEVAAVERRGLMDAGLAELAATSVADAILRTVRLAYHDVAGTGITVASQYRWQSTQPRLALNVHWSRPFALPVTLEAQALWARPRYDLGAPLTLRTHGGDLGVRSVLGPRTIASLSFHGRVREFSAPVPYARPGRLAGLELALDHGILRSDVQALGLSARAFRAASWTGSALDCWRGLSRLRYVRSLGGPPEEGGLPKTAIAAQVHLGQGSTGLPLDEMFLLGVAATEMDLPLRSHRQRPGGILGNAPIAQRFGLVNVELRQRVWNARRSQGGVVLFYDGARVSDTAQGTGDASLNDIGIGLRFAFPGLGIVRADYGRSPTSNGKSALTIGLGQIF